MKVKVLIATDIDIEVDDKFKALTTDFTEALENELVEGLFDKLCDSTIKIHGVQINAVYWEDKPLVEY